MKKQILLPLFLFFAFAANCQANLDFESWANDAPVNWETWATFGLTTIGGPAGAYQETTAPGEGSSSARLSTEDCAVCPSFQLPGVLPGILIQEESYTQKPDQLDFLYKSAVMTNDTALVYVEVSHWDGTQRVTDGYCVSEFTTNENTTTWTSVSEPFIYDPTSGTPDSISIYVFSSAGSAPVVGSEFFIDAISLGFLNIESLEEASALRVFPNPASDNLNIELSEDFESIEIISLDGKIILTEKINASTAKINVSNLKDGVYLYSVKTMSGELITNRFVKN